MKQSQNSPINTSPKLEKDAMQAGQKAMERLLKKYETQAKREKKASTSR